MSIPIAYQILEIERELRQREPFYEKRVAEGRMEKREADRRMERMRAALETLREVEKKERLI
jgi:hypothetical protein